MEIPKSIAHKMTTYYHLHIVKTEVTLKASYRGNTFLKIEKVKGSLSKPELKAIGYIIPPTLNDVPAFISEWKGKVTYMEIVKDKSIFSKYNAIWFEFFTKYSGFSPAFSGIDGKALKQIETKLTKITGTQEEGLLVFQTLLNAWPTLSKFHQDHTDLKYIKSQLNVLLNGIKNSNNKHTATGASSDLRRKTAEGLGFVQPE